MGGAALVGALALRDPHVEGSWGACPFLLLTGRPCPGCGGLRAVNDLTHGDVTAALSSNLLAVVLLGSLVVAWVVWVVRRARGQRVLLVRLTPTLVGGVAAAFAVFGVLRVTPWGSWLAP